MQHALRTQNLKCLFPVKVWRKFSVDAATLRCFQHFCVFCVLIFLLQSLECNLGGQFWTHLISYHLIFSHLFQTTDLFAMIEKMQVMCFLLHFSYFPFASHLLFRFLLLIEYIHSCICILRLMFIFVKSLLLANNAIQQQMISLQEQMSWLPE